MASSDVKPDTSDSKESGHVKRQYSNGGRLGGTTATKTKRSMAKKAVIVCDRWGPSIHGGVTDGLHLAIRLLQDMGISVHCTALQATEEEEREAEEMGVTLHLPTKTGVFEFREPHRDWLLYHNIHFPKLEELTNVKFVFGFSAFTSEAAFHITCKVFPKASCYLINLFDKDDITPLIVGCSKEELEFLKRVMSDEFKNAKCSFSVGERVYARYRRLYRDSNQQLLSPTVFEEYLSPSISEPLPIAKHETFQILSIVQEYEFEDPKKLDAIISAINTVAENLDLLDETPPAWKIIGIPPSKEEEIVEKLQRSPALKITPTYVKTTEEFNRELFSSHLVLIPPSSTSYANLTLAAMCAAIPIVYPRRSHSHEIVNEHIDIIEARECAIDMDRDPTELAKRITSVVRKNLAALEIAKKIRQHIIEKVAADLKGVNEAFIATLTTDMQYTSSENNEPARQTKNSVERNDNEPSMAEHLARTVGDTEISGTSGDQECKGKRDTRRGNEEGLTSTERENNGDAISDQNKSPKLTGKGKLGVKKSKGRSRGFPLQQLWLKKNKRRRQPCQIEVKVKPDGVIPQEGKKVREVTTAFYSHKRTKDNAVLVGKQLDQRRNGMSLNHIGENSISYIMDCQSSEALESLMGDYSSGSLHMMVKSTFLSESLLDEIGALYLSLGTSIDYEEYLICQEELADVEDENIYQLHIEAIEKMNENIESDVQRKRAAVTIGQVKAREKAKDRDILRGMEVEQETVQVSQLGQLFDEWIQIKKQLQELNNSHPDLVFSRQEFVRSTGSIIDEVDIPLEIKQELMVAFQKFQPLSPGKTGKPDQKLVIEGDVLMKYLENIVNDFEIPTKLKQNIIEQFGKLIRTKSGKENVKGSLAAKQEVLQKRIQNIVNEADIPDEWKEVYQQLRQVERDKPLKNTKRILLWSADSDSIFEVRKKYNPRGLTINKNGHVVVSEYGHGDNPGNVMTLTTDTAQILTSVTVHDLPQLFVPQDTKIADNGDYYIVDDGNKCIVVSDAKSNVKKTIAMGKLKGPTGVFVDKDGNVFIADDDGNCVVKCNGDGDVISSQQLSSPYSLTMNSKHQLLVSCRGYENCIYVLDSNLEILNRFGSGHLVKPRGVKVDSVDNIYVADNGKIVKFDRQGEYQECRRLYVDVYDIAVFPDGRIVYSDDDESVRIIYA